MTSEALAHAKNSGAADQRANARRSDQLDAGAASIVSRLGAQPEGLRSGPEKETSPVAGHPSSVTRASRGERDEDSYVMESGMKLLKVLECMEGSNFEPVTFNRIMDRSGFDRSFVRSALITLKKGRWVKEIVTSREREFVLGPKAENLARNLSREMLKRQ